MKLPILLTNYLKVPFSYSKAAKNAKKSREKAKMVDKMK